MIRKIRGCRSVVRRLWLVVLVHTVCVVSEGGGKELEAAALRGAHRMPYVRYEADRGKLGGGAELRGPSFDQAKVESEASERMYVVLSRPRAYVEWVMQKPVGGVVLRFTMPDSVSGDGISGRLTVYVNGKWAKNLELTSYHAWQYFNTTEGPRHPHNDPKHAKGAGGARMRFDEIRFMCALRASDRIRLQKDHDDGVEYGVDFIEVEPIPAPIPKPEGYLDVRAYGAMARPDSDDSHAFTKALAACVARGRGLYVPPGRYRLGGRIELKHDRIRMQGAGVWHTELYFTSLDKRSGGIYGTGSRIRISDLYLGSRLNKREGYRAFGQHWGKASVIENVWLEHFNTGFWVGHYGSAEASVADGLIVRNCRIRNTYADGLNFAKGSRNCVIEYCNVRNTGDDGLASWASDLGSVASTEGNAFRFNTVENVWRAAGIGIFGGKGHQVENCIVRDSFAGPGVRINAVFPGHAFGDDRVIRISNVTVERCGTRSSIFQKPLGAIDLQVRRYDVRNVVLRDVEIKDSLFVGILVHALHNEPSHTIRNVRFERVSVSGVGEDMVGPAPGLLVRKGVSGWIETKGVRFLGVRGKDVLIESPGFELRRVGSSR